MSKIISIDLEFNKDKEVLSAGILQVEKGTLRSINEFFFENKVDKYTYKIHGLSEDFLKKNSTKGIKESDLRDMIKDSNYIVGFDLRNDFVALNMNSNLMYGGRKAIDIKYILSFFDIKGSLESVSKKLGIFSKCKGMFPIHTSIMDSLLSYLIFEYFFVFISSEKKIDKKEILKDLADMSSYSYFSEPWMYDYHYEKYFSLYRELKKIDKINIPKKVVTSKRVKISFTNHTEIYDEHFNIVGKIKKAKTKKENKFFKPEISLGYKE